mgnify:CR=1 FL=1
MKKTITFSFLFFLSQWAFAQDAKKAALYTPFENADSALSVIKAQAAKEENMY